MNRSNWLARAEHVAPMIFLLVFTLSEARAATAPYFLTPLLAPAGAPPYVYVSSIDDKGNAIGSLSACLRQVVGTPCATNDQAYYWTSGVSSGKPLANPGKLTDATLINEAGEVAGSGWAAGNVAIGVVWSPNTGSTFVTPPIQTSYLTALSETGAAVGAALYSGTRNAILWNKGKLTNLGNLSTSAGGNDYAAALSISPGGRYVVGEADDFYHTMAVSYQGGRVIELPLVQGYGEAAEDNFYLSSAQQVTDTGAIYGVSAYVGSDDNWHQHAALWIGGVVHDLGDSSGTLMGDSSFASANQNGHAVGTATSLVVPCCGTQQDRVHAVLWNGTHITDLGVFKGDTNSFGASINESDIVVGTSQTAAGVPRAVVWQNGKIEDLNALIPPKNHALYKLTNAIQVTTGGYILALGNFISSGAPATFLLTPSIPTSISIRSSAASSRFGEKVTLFASVVPKTGNSVPRSYVTFMDGNRVLGGAALNGIGVAQFTTSDLAIGAHSITATFGGYIPNAASTSPVFVQRVGITGTTTTVSSSASTLARSQKFNLTATVLPAYGTIAGTVTFKAGSDVLGVATVNSRTKQGVLGTSIKAPGKYVVTAHYAGTVDFSSSTSPGVALTVN